MSRPLNTRLRALTAGFVAAIFLIACGAWYLSNAIELHAAQNRWVEHTFEVLNTLEQLMTEVKEVESAQRGQLLRPNEKSLDRSNEGVRQIWIAYDRLHVLTGDNQTQQQDIEELAALIRVRLSQLADAVDKFQRTGKLDAATGDFKAGQEAMDKIRDQVNLIEGRERALLQARTKSAETQSRYVEYVLAAFSLACFVVITSFFVVFRRHMLEQWNQSRRRDREVWIRSGEADAGLAVAGDRPVAEVLKQMTEFIGTRLQAQAVSFYAESGGRLKYVTGTLPESGSRGAVQFEIGKGLIGQAAKANAISFVDEVPADFFQIESAIGAAQPGQLAYAPLRFRGELLGLLEVGAFGRIGHTLGRKTDEIKEWLECVATVFAASLSSARSGERLRELLEASQRQAEELQMQQEELRTTTEELEEQTKALLESQNQLQIQAEELRQANEELEGQTRSLESQQESLQLKNQALETARRKLEDKTRELERASAYKSEFLAKMSHELRTPLNSVMILATLLRENKEGNLQPRQIEFARTIYESGADLLDLISDILDLSKLEAKKLAARPEAFSARGFVEQIGAPFRLQAEKKGLQFHMKVDADVSDRVFTDRQRLTQIARNFLSNAIKFTEQGEITLRLSVDPDRPDCLKLSVTDTGIGIPTQKKKKIWEAFEQADGSVSRRYGGTGLGLTISLELAQLLGGHVSVDSKEGEGSVFTFTFPREFGTATPKEEIARESHESNSSAALESPKSSVAEHRPETAQPENSQPETLQSKEEQAAHAEASPAKSILIIENDHEFREAVADAARAHGFQPVEATDAESALEALTREGRVLPQAILLDHSLPDIPGKELLGRIRKIPAMSGVPIHMISADGDQHSVLRAGAIGYFGKPVSIDGVRAALNRIENLIEKKVKRLLVVEDDETQRRAICELVSSPQTEIVAVGSGRRALEEMKTAGCDCIILDLKLPDMSGFDLLLELEKSEFSLPPVIIYTGQDLSKDDEDRLRRYSNSIILKGAKSPDRLLDEVNLFLHRVESDLPDATARLLKSDPGVNEPQESFRGRMILLVDDDVRNLFALTSALEALGFRVTVARNGLEALQKLDAYPETDVVLMDIMMPKMDGFEAMRQIRAKSEFKKLPVIALTAKAMRGEQEKCIEAGANDYLPKPISLPNLISLLKVWVPAKLEKRVEVQA